MLSGSWWARFCRARLVSWERPVLCDPVRPTKPAVCLFVGVVLSVVVPIQIKPCWWLMWLSHGLLTSHMLQLTWTLKAQKAGDAITCHFNCRTEWCLINKRWWLLVIWMWSFLTELSLPDHIMCPDDWTLLLLIDLLAHPWCDSDTVNLCILCVFAEVDFSIWVCHCTASGHCIT